MHEPLAPWALIAAVFMLAGAVKGIAGLGLPTVAIGPLSLWMTPMQAAAVLLLPSLVTNVQQMLAGRALPALMRRLWPMMVGTLAGGAASAALLGQLDPRVSGGVLGLVLLVYGLLGLAGRELPAPGRHERWLGAPIGAATGLLAGATAVYAVPAVPYLQALGLPRDALVQALGLSFTVSTIALGGVLLHGGRLSAGLASDALVALAAAVIGMAIGNRVRRRLSVAVFRRAFLLATCALGAQLAFRAVG